MKTGKQIMYTGKDNKNRIEFFTDHNGFMQGKHICFDNNSNMEIWSQYWKDNMYHGESRHCDINGKPTNYTFWKNNASFGQQDPK